MKCHRLGTRQARRGATLVEFALLISLFLMFIFGILEYSRYLFVLHVTTNAARDGARFAAVRVNQSDLVNPTRADIPEYPGRPTFDIPEFTTAVTDSMAGTQNMIDNFRVRVFPCDPVGMYGDPIVIQPKSQAGIANPTWNNAVFSERIAIRIDGQYRVIVPNLLLWQDTLNIRIISLVSSEG